MFYRPDRLSLWDMASVDDMNDEEAFVEDEPDPTFEEPQNDQVFIQGDWIKDTYIIWIT